MKQYELLVVLPGTMEETIVSDMVQQVKTIVEKHGGENITMQDRGKSRLAYP
ncbi:MAG: 30S ribosomal protein S6, partial [Candidatus Magasanikbacteria bacterium CG_4_9_14_0_2_um_filter_41_10]